MKNNIVFITAMGDSKTLSHKKICYESWEWWCNKHNITLRLLESPIVDVKLMKPTWQRYFLYKILEKDNIDYNQIALVDLDTIVSWECPNFFALTNEELSVTVDHDNLPWIHESIKGYQNFFLNTELSWLTYFNAGFTIVSQKHKYLFDKIIDFYNLNSKKLLTLEDQVLKRGTDQTPVNFLVNHLGYKINFLPKVYNLTYLKEKQIFLNRYFLELGYIWHFNGSIGKLRDSAMRETWEMIKDNYK